LKGALGDGLGIPHSDKRFAGFSKESEASKGALEVPVVVESSKDPQDGEKGVPEKKRRQKKLARKRTKLHVSQEPPRGADATENPGGTHPLLQFWIV
jgi:hypothetical protein